MIFEEFYKILTKITKFWKNNFLKDKKKNYIRQILLWKKNFKRLLKERYKNRK